MSNKEVARAFARLGKIMELHDENPFKIKSYSNIYLTLRKLDTPLTEMSEEDLSSVRGVGKAILDKINELLTTGELQTYQKYLDKTPECIVRMLYLKFFFPKKIKLIWKDLGIETIGELLYACEENRLVALKGFGLKTQETLRKQLEYFISSQGKYHYSSLIDEAEDLITEIKARFPTAKSSLCGEIRRMIPEVKSIEVLTTVTEAELLSSISEIVVSDTKLEYKGYPCQIYHVEDSEFGSELYERSASPDFLAVAGSIAHISTEEEVFKMLGIAPVPAEYRESEIAYRQAKSNTLPDLIEMRDLRGVIHNHSTYSDGLHSVREMAEYTKEAGYEYLVMSDHSKAAFYANGLKEDRCIAQMEEVDSLNKEFSDFKIFKSIECDILNDGSLDYDDDFLREFDLIIASVHSNLRMDETKANARLIKAIEHPSTHILGHMTSRLLLAREGYPINHEKIIDACISNGVVIELNANPHRLDVDWTWIPYILERGGTISINPDAHNKAQIHYMKYGVAVARKGGLTAASCLNALPLDQFQKWVDGLE